MVESDCSVSLSSLLCREDESCLKELDEEDDEEFFCANDYCVLEKEEEYIEMLVSKESSFSSYGHSDECLVGVENWLKCARLNAVRWILKTRAFFGFDIQTAYLSITYFDRFLSRRAVDNGKYWVIQLLSVACLSLAAKMEECRVPALSEFRVEEFDFESKVIQRMEFLVLNTLEWRMNSVTPFAYLNYFVTKFCDESKPKALLSRAVELIFAITEVINLMDYRPSAIAAAAILAASDRRLTKKSVEFKMGMISLCGSLEIEHVFSCYNLMREFDSGKFKLSKILISPDLSSYASSMDVVHITSTSVSNKRRRLVFSDYGCGLYTSGEKQFH